VPNKPNEIESKLLKACKKGKLKAQEMLYKQFYAYGMSISLRYAYNRDEAAEVLNDSFLKVFKNISKYNQEQVFKAWLRKIIINTAIDYYRKNKNHYELLDTEITDIESLDYSLIEQFEIDDLQLLLNELPKNYRITFNLYEVEGYKHDEIAKLLNITSGTSRSNLTRAKALLRVAFKKHFKYKYAKVI